MKREAAATECLVHILIPCYGRVAYLRESVQSVITELGRHGDSRSVRITVVDDASPRSEIAEAVAAFPEVSYLRNARNLGIVGNFNHCLEISEGKYSVFMGSDDLFSPGYLEQITFAIREFCSPTIICPSVAVIDWHSQPSNPLADRVKRVIMPRRTGRVPSLANRDFSCVESSGDRAVARLMVGDYLYFPALAWKTQALRSVGFSQSAGVATDLYAACRCLLRGGTLVTFRSRPAVFRYRRHAESASSVGAGDGTRVEEERWVHEQVGRLARQRGWKLTPIAASLRPTSRLHSWSGRVGSSRLGQALASVTSSAGGRANTGQPSDRS